MPTAHFFMKYYFIDFAKIQHHEQTLPPNLAAIGTPGPMQSIPVSTESIKIQ